MIKTIKWLLNIDKTSPQTRPKPLNWQQRLERKKKLFGKYLP